MQWRSEECGSSLLNEAVIKQCLDNESIVIPDSSLPLLPSDWFYTVRLLWRDSAIMRYDARCVIWQYQDHYLLTVTQMDIQQIEEFYNVAPLCRSTLDSYIESCGTNYLKTRLAVDRVKP